MTTKEGTRSLNFCEGECVDVFVCVLDHFLILIVMRCYVQVINADMFITYLASVLSCGGHRIARRHLIPSRTRDVIYIYVYIYIYI